MFAQERREHIMQFLKEKKRIEVKELEELFEVSGATLRTDLRELEKEGKLVRTHGGALFREEEIRREETLKSRKNQIQKKQIAGEARKYIKENDTLILDSGSTTLELAREVKDAKNLRIITNDLQIALELQDNPWIDLYLIGGRVRNQFCLTHGAIGIDFLKSISVQKVFLAPNALSVYEGAATSNEEMKAIKQAMMSASREAYMLCDSSKIGKRAFCKFADVSEFVKIFTDEGICRTDQEALEEQGASFAICKGS
mgnify:CR=1 FL=1|nr:DeoR/GlpR family DNA-binding transcription regulator [uncultured Anaerostipes sp.]